MKMPCGHVPRMLSDRVGVCSVDCDLDIRPKCEKCGSRNLKKHDFGSDPVGQAYNQMLPEAVQCQDCENVMHYGVTP